MRAHIRHTHHLGGIPGLQLVRCTSTKHLGGLGCQGFVVLGYDCTRMVVFAHRAIKPSVVNNSGICERGR
jgi:hypothetical protein